MDTRLIVAVALAFAGTAALVAAPCERKAPRARYAHPTDVPRSQTYGGIRWLSDLIDPKVAAERGDSYPQTWTDDDRILFSSGDPLWLMHEGRPKVGWEIEQKTDAARDDVFRRMSGLSFEELDGTPTDGYEVRRVNDMRAYVGWGGCGPKPTGLLFVDGALYFAVDNLLGWKPPRYGVESQHASDATILRSTDCGKTWEPNLDARLDALFDPKTGYDRAGNWEGNWKTPPDQRVKLGDFTPMFPGNLFGGPSFIQYGKAYADAVDGYVYAISTDHWDNGSELRLGRVPRDRIMDRSAWEFAAPYADGTVEWTRDLYRSEPVLAIERHISAPEMVYLAKEKKYLLFTWAMHKDFTTVDGSELSVFESDTPWGPFRLVHYDWMWYREEAGLYCPKLPLKFFDQKTLQGYLLCSGNWEVQDRYYRAHFQKFELLRKVVRK